MNKEYIKKENEAIKYLEANGYHSSGYDFKEKKVTIATNALTENDFNAFYKFNSFQEAADKLL